MRFKFIEMININGLIIAGVGNLYERCHLGFLRRWAANECLEQIKADDLFTNCISIGPVSCNYQLHESVNNESAIIFRSPR